MPPKKKCKKGAPKWSVSFADLATLMLTFFVIMISFANMDIQNFRMLLGAIRDGFGVQKEHHGQFQAVLIRNAQDEVSEERGGKSSGSDADNEVSMVADAAQQAAISSGLQNDAQITKGKKGVRIKIKGHVLFDPGRADLKKDIKKFIAGIAKALKTHKQLKLVVEGHTDSIPIHTEKFPSNWELSSARASAVIRELAETHKIAPDRLLAIGYADNNSLNMNQSPLERAENRRVEFIISRVARFSPEN